MVSVETLDREWDGKPYKQVKASVSNGKRIITYTADDKKGLPLPVIMPFSRIRIAVDYASSDKGNLTVKGAILDA